MTSDLQPKSPPHLPLQPTHTSSASSASLYAQPAPLPSSSCISLHNHFDGYDLSPSEYCQMAMCCSGRPLATRHFDKASEIFAYETSSTCAAHTACCLLEHIPVIGLITALFDKCCLGSSDKNAVTPITAVLTNEQKNLLQACIQHRIRPFLPRPPPQEALSIASKSSTHALSFAHRYKDSNLLGLCESYGGYEVAIFLSQAILRRFESMLQECNQNPTRTFEKLIRHIQNEIVIRKEWDYQGASMVCCYIDRKTQAIYTATIGSLEAYLVRETNPSNFSIFPLSLAYSIRVEEEYKRIQQALLRIQHSPTPLTLETSPKRIRYVHNKAADHISASRAVGFGFLHSPKDTETVLPQIEITKTEVGVGDQILLFNTYASKSIGLSNIVAIRNLTTEQTFFEKIQYYVRQNALSPFHHTPEAVCITVSKEQESTERKGALSSLAAPPLAAPL